MDMRGLAKIFAAAVLCVSGLAWGQELVVTPDRASATYNAGETVTWTIELKGDAAALASARYQIKPNGAKASSEGDLAFNDGKATLSATLPQPGWVFLDIDAKGADDKKIKATGGAVFSPEQIKPALARPADFDQFWDAKIKELSDIPANPVLRKQDAGKPNVDYWQIDMDNIRGSKVRGQIARPSAEGKYPAILVVQWAGVYPLQKPWVVDRAADGWLAMNILAHDLPIDQPAEFYQEQNKGPLSGYTGIGNEDRETSYFLRMYLSCYRAAEYLTTRDDWNGEVLVVTGGSQGGLQTIVTAGLHPKITAGIAGVPAGCEMSPQSAGRMVGWPYWPHTRTKDKDIEQITKVGQYFDATNFASRIKCPMLIGLGGVDTTCPAVNVYSMINQITAPKEIVFMPNADHGKNHQPYYSRTGAWMSQLKAGNPPPLAK